MARVKLPFVLSTCLESTKGKCYLRPKVKPTSEVHRQFIHHKNVTQTRRMIVCIDRTRGVWLQRGRDLKNWTLDKARAEGFETGWPLVS